MQTQTADGELSAKVVTTELHRSEEGHQVGLRKMSLWGRGKDELIKVDVIVSAASFTKEATEMETELRTGH